MGGEGIPGGIDSVDGDAIVLIADPERDGHLTPGINEERCAVWSECAAMARNCREMSESIRARPRA